MESVSLVEKSKESWPLPCKLVRNSQNQGLEPHPQERKKLVPHHPQHPEGARHKGNPNQHVLDKLTDQKK